MTTGIKLFKEFEMNIYISMLRGINVGGQKKIRMEELVFLYQGLGFSQVKTYIQSGNIIFKTPAASPEILARQIERKIKEVLELGVIVIIRTKEEMQKIVKETPFSAKDPARLHVTFLSEAVDNPPINQVSTIKAENEGFHFSGREIYLFCPNGYGKTRLNNHYFEKLLGTTATSRNWNTVNQLIALAGSV